MASGDKLQLGGVFASLITAAVIAGASAVVGVAVLVSRADANDEKVNAIETEVDAVKVATIELKTDSKWIKSALKELLRERGLPAPSE